MTDLSRGTRGVGESDFKYLSWIYVVLIVLRQARSLEGGVNETTRREGRDFGQRTVETFELRPLTAATHLYTCANFAHVRHSPKPVRLNSKELQRLSDSVWRGKPHSAVDFSEYTRILLGPETFFPPELELTTENVCFGALFHIWFRQGKSLYLT